MFRDRLGSEPLVGTWVSSSDPAVAEMTAPGFDFVMLDTEHAPNSDETIAHAVRAVEAADGEAVPLARPLDNDRGKIKRLLDIGVRGVMVPLVETADGARSAVSAAKYPPSGQRGVAATRASDYGRRLESYVGEANEDIAVVVQVETQRGLENVEAIAATEGVDALFVGPADLSANLGVFAEYDGDRFREAVDAVLTAGDEADIPVGTLATSAAAVERYTDWGFDWLIAGTDIGHLQRGAAEMRTLAREQLQR
ncbi:HpcH/HpaI aldolase/citrate lyase family protein [Halosegnis sp.]|uniref:HpcH/HpaI aldolase family protein n=1 Tax=Halosegnis sp. TaxID=2864959 RepID=UPI0035D50AF2